MRVGIDLGGTKIEGILLGDDGVECARDRVATPHDGYHQVLNAIAGLVARLEGSLAHGRGTSPQVGTSEALVAPSVGAGGPASVGIATPGFLSPRDGLLRNSNLIALNNHALDRDLTALLGRPVRVDNDANCFVLSEATDGAAAPRPGDRDARQRRIVFGVTLGTGIGGGFVIDGEVWGGANGSAGEWSHTTLPFLRPEDGPGSGCTVCGHPACIESFLSGRGLAWDYECRSGQAASPVDVGLRAQQSDPAAVATFTRYEDRLARALAGVINLVDPSVIVLGGGISNNLRLFENVPRVWQRYTVARDLATRLVRAQHGDASGVRGAAWLWPLT